MGKTPKSKNINNGGKSHLQPKVLLHRPMYTGMGRMSFPGISEQSAPPKRRMKLSGTLSRKSSHGKGVIIKVYSSSIAEQKSEISRIPRMSVVTAESSESLTTIHQTGIILENGKEDSQGAEEEKCFKDKPVANSSELDANILPNSDTGDVDENPSIQVKEINSLEEPVDGIEPSSSVKLPKEDEGESKKQRSGTPQSRSSTPQRKSGRVRSKHDSPNKSAPSTLTPGIKVLKINMTPGKNITNGTMETRSKVECDNAKVKGVKATDAEPQKSFEANATNENDSGDIEAVFVQSEDIISETNSKIQATDAPYLRSLRMVSGRRSLTSNSPSKSLPVSSPSGSSPASSTQWRKRQSRKKDSTHMKDEPEYQGTENEYNSSVNSGKRKERTDDQGISFPVSNVKKSKNEDDFKLYLSDESEENNHLEIESEEYFNTSQLSKSSDDVIAELKDLNESASSDDHFIKNESIEYTYEAREIESCEKLHEIPTATNQSSNKRWCILM